MGITITFITVTLISIRAAYFKKEFEYKQFLQSTTIITITDFINLLSSLAKYKLPSIGRFSKLVHKTYRYCVTFRNFSKVKTKTRTNAYSFNLIALLSLESRGVENLNSLWCETKQPAGAMTRSIVLIIEKKLHVI